MPGRSEKPTKKGFGGCTFSKVSPTSLKSSVSVISFTISFEEALKLNLSIDECVRKLNSYDRSKRRNKKAALAVIVRLNRQRIQIGEGKVNDE